MLLKMGVDTSRLADPMRRILETVDQAYIDAGDGEAVCTSTYEGTHSTGSLHYVNRAADFRKTPKIERIAVALRNKLGKHYDVVVEATHLHVEHDPK